MIEDKITKLIENNEIVLFMKGNENIPQCGFSAAVVSILNKIDCKYIIVDVLESNEMREGIKKYSDWPTIPQLYIGKEFIGGCDIIKEMYENGELAKLFENKGIGFKPKS